MDVVYTRVQRWREDRGGDVRAKLSLMLRELDDVSLSLAFSQLAPETDDGTFLPSIHSLGHAPAAVEEAPGASVETVESRLAASLVEAEDADALPPLEDAPARALPPALAEDARYEFMHALIGGMGTVYIVYDHATKFPFAIKTLRQDVFLSRAETLPQFLRETELWTSLGTHPHIVRAYGTRLIGALPYLFMEFVPGPTLKEILARQRPDPAEVVEAGLMVCAALRHANLRAPGFVHGDLKPSNLLVVDGSLKVTDFGLARTSTDPAVAGGTPTTMAPEQWRGEELDRRTDLYALGCILYEMLTGSLPFPGTSVRELRAGHLGAPVPELTLEKPFKDLGPLVRDMLTKELPLRPRMPEVWRRLRALRKKGRATLLRKPGEVRARRAHKFREFKKRDKIFAAMGFGKVFGGSLQEAVRRQLEGLCRKPLTRAGVDALLALSRLRVDHPRAFEGVDMAGLQLGELALQGAGLRGVFLPGVSLAGRALGGADLREADLRGADLRGADLRRADLRGADLQDALLAGALLEGADLRAASLKGADLDGCDLRSCKLEGVRCDNVDAARARWPDGFELAAHQGHRGEGLHVLVGVATRGLATGIRRPGCGLFAVARRDPPSELRAPELARLEEAVREAGPRRRDALGRPLLADWLERAERLGSDGLAALLLDGGQLFAARSGRFELWRIRVGVARVLLPAEAEPTGVALSPQQGDSFVCLDSRDELPRLGWDQPHRAAEQLAAGLDDEDGAALVVHVRRVLGRTGWHGPEGLVALAIDARGGLYAVDRAGDYGPLHGLSHGQHYHLSSAEEPLAGAPLAAAGGLVVFVAEDGAPVLLDLFRQRLEPLSMVTLSVELPVEAAAVDPVSGRVALAFRKGLAIYDRSGGLCYEAAGDFRAAPLALSWARSVFSSGLRLFGLGRTGVVRQELSRLVRLRGGALAAAFGVDGSFALLGQDYRSPTRGGERAVAERAWTVRLTRKGRLVETLWLAVEEEQAAVALRFSPDGRWLAAGIGRRLAVWELTAGYPLRCLTADVPCVAFDFAEDGRQLAYAFDDGRVGVWELAPE